MKIKYALPIAQMVLAGALIVLDSSLSRFASRMCDMAGPSPAVRLLMAINTPLLIPRIAWGQYVPYRYETAVWIAAVGLLWSLIGFSLPFWRSLPTIVLWRPLRFIIDLVPIVAGAACALLALKPAFEILNSFTYGVGCFGPNLWFSFLPSILITCCYFAWSIVLIYIFGRDLVHCVFGKRLV